MHLIIIIALGIFGGFWLCVRDVSWLDGAADRAMARQTRRAVRAERRTTDGGGTSGVAVFATAILIVIFTLKLFKNGLDPIPADARTGTMPTTRQVLSRYAPARHQRSMPAQCRGARDGLYDLACREPSLGRKLVRWLSPVDQERVRLLRTERT